MAYFITTQIQEPFYKKIPHQIQRMGVLRFINLAMISLIMITIPLTVILAQQTQQIQQHAASAVIPTPTPPPGCYYKCMQLCKQEKCSDLCVKSELICSVK